MDLIVANLSFYLFEKRAIVPEEITYRDNPARKTYAIDNQCGTADYRKYINEYNHIIPGFPAEKTGKIPLYLPVTISSFV